MTINSDILSIVKVIIPEYPVIQAADMRQIEEYTALFVKAEIQDLDMFFSLSCLAMLKIFYLLPLIVYGRTYNALTLTKQKEYVSKWENSKLRFLRDFIKLFRYLTIISFYDNQLVQNVIGIDREKHRQDSIRRRLELIGKIN